MRRVNEQVAGRLEEAARLLRDQGADRFRVGAYLRAASTVRSMREPLDELFQRRGLEGLKELPHVGESIARAICELLTHGRLPMLDRLRGEADPIALLASVAGIGRVFAERLHDELGLETLADLEAAAHDGRLETIAGFGAKRLAGIRDSLAQRLGRVRVPERTQTLPGVPELLDVDREYREREPQPANSNALHHGDSIPRASPGCRFSTHVVGAGDIRRSSPTPPERTEPGKRAIGSSCTATTASAKAGIR